MSCCSCRSVRRAVASSSAARRLDAELVPEAIQQPQHERVAADERVTRQAVALLAEHRRDPDRTGGPRHVAALAARAPRRRTRCAATPGSSSAPAAIRSRGRRGPTASVISVWQVAQSSDCTDVRRLDLLEPGHRAHDRAAGPCRRRTARRASRTPSARVGRRRKLPLKRSPRRGRRGRSGGRPCRTRRRARGGRAAIGVRGRPESRRTVASVPYRRVRPSVPSACGRRRTRPGSRATCDGWSIVSRRTLAWKYGSRAALAMIVDRQAVPIDTSSPPGVVRLLWQATQFRSGVNSPAAACARRPVACRWRRPRTLGTQRDDEQQRGSADQAGEHGPWRMGAVIATSRSS